MTWLPSRLPPAAVNEWTGTVNAQSVAGDNVEHAMALTQASVAATYFSFAGNTITVLRSGQYKVAGFCATGDVGGVVCTVTVAILAAGADKVTMVGADGDAFGVRWQGTLTAGQTIQFTMKNNGGGSASAVSVSGNGWFEVTFVPIKATPQ